MFKCHLEDYSFEGIITWTLYQFHLNFGQKVQSSFGFGGLIRSLSKRSISLVTSSGVLHSISGITLEDPENHSLPVFLQQT